METKSRVPRIAVIGLKGLPAFGGAAKSIEDLIRNLSKFYEFTLYEIQSHADTSYIIENVTRNIIPVPKVKRINTLYYYLASVYRVLKDSNFDLVITNHLYCGFIIPFLRLKYPVINIAHGIVPKNDNKWNFSDKLFFRLFELLSVKFSNLVISVTNIHIDYLKNIGAKKVIFIPNGIDLMNNYNFQSSKENYLSFAAARVIKLKGCHTFLEACKIGKISNPIKIIGDIDQVISYKNELMHLSENLEVVYLGLIKEREKLFEIIHKSIAFVFPSFNEGMSNMLLEVASLKVPIICSDIPENKAVFADDEVLFFKVGNSNDLATKICFCLANYEIMKAKSELAFKKIEDKYNWQSIAFQYKFKIEELIKVCDDERN